MSNVPPPLPQSPPTRNRRTLLIGCLGLLVVLGAVVLLVLMAAFASLRVAERSIEQYVARQPGPLPKLEFSELENAALESKFVEVYRAFHSGDAVELVLNTTELNAALADNTDLEKFLWIEIAEGRLNGRMSLPLADLGWQGRWLNGDAALSLSATNGVVRLAVEHLTVNGKRVPTPLLEPVTGDLDLLEDAIDNAEAREYIAAIDFIRVDGDQLRIGFKAE